MDMSHSGHAAGTGPSSADPPSRHGMAVVGDGTPFLSHLPMPHSPHHYQAVIQGSFGSFDRVYQDDRKAHPESRLYTFNPEPFVLPELFPGPAGQPPARTSFTGSLVRNHFEEPPAHPETSVEIATDVVVDVRNVVFHHRFDPQTEPLETLTYILFGQGPERLLAHRIIGPFVDTRHQEFDHLLSADIQGVQVSDEQLRRGVEVTVTGRPNEPDAKLKERDKAAAVAAVNGQSVPVEIDVKTDMYFETADFQ
ncbi:hypothetical protein AB0D04_10975 [Streptomyces sp. NPDC048483]|uniref:hypothetical protein n=1 Tax=Streptomyces sp. NPDC048483 TaxID=3154927 RepID=UPI0034260CD1